MKNTHLFRILFQVSKVVLSSSYENFNIQLPFPLLCVVFHQILDRQISIFKSFLELQ